MRIYPVTLPYMRFIKIREFFKKKLLSNSLKKYFKREVLFFNSGKSSLFFILNFLKSKNPSKDEVIIPAYTAPELVLPILKAGLRVKLVDINLENFGYSIKDLEKKLTDKTFAIIVVHLFGIVQNPEEVRKEGITLIEDFAQGFGGYLGLNKVGTLCDVSFTSFLRGKNLSLGEGGVLIFKKDIFSDVLLEKHTFSFLKEIKALIRYYGISFFSNPDIYGFFYPLLNFFKQKTPSSNFVISEFPSILDKIGGVLFDEIINSYLNVIYNVNFIYNSLNGVDDLILPHFPSGSNSVLTRFPLIFKSKKKMFFVKQKLRENGFETSRFYLKPVHEHFDLGYREDEFPNAKYLAEYLLTIPCHYKLKKDDIIKMVEIIKSIKAKV